MTQSATDTCWGGPATRPRQSPKRRNQADPACYFGMPTTTRTAANSSSPLDVVSFVAPLALPGDDLAPEQFVAFYIDGGKGLYIHPHVWHEGVFPLADTAKFYDEQGKVHARVSCNIANEFGVLLEVPLRAPD